ncbi:MAG: hypothetical protein Q7S34_00225 [bacterium]|nr:hypothetical protein [bacterium]
MAIFERISKIGFSIMFFVVPVFFAYAVDIENPLGPGNTTFEAVISRIADFAVLIATPIAVIVILYAGVLFMTSAGDVEKVKKAKRALLWALVGLGIVLIGRGFIAIIRDALSGGGGGGGYEGYL